MKTQHTPVPSFSVTGDEEDLIHDIAKRAVKMAEEFGGHYAMMDAEMDLCACVANGCPLRLADLLKADDGNFTHDVFGIRRHIDRTTGKLGDCFLPRYAIKKAGHD